MLLRVPSDNNANASVASELELALLSRVRDCPCEVGPRQIYADWLIGRNDPRGEFIATQCELANNELGGARAQTLQARQWELLEQFGGQWFAGTEANAFFRRSIVAGFVHVRPPLLHSADCKAASGNCLYDALPVPMERQPFWAIDSSMSNVELSQLIRLAPHAIEATTDSGGLAETVERLRRAKVSQFVRSWHVSGQCAAGGVVAALARLPDLRALSLRTETAIDVSSLSQLRYLSVEATRLPHIEFPEQIETAALRANELKLAETRLPPSVRGLSLVTTSFVPSRWSIPSAIEYLELKQAVVLNSPFIERGAGLELFKNLQQLALSIFKSHLCVETARRLETLEIANERRFDMSALVDLKSLTRFVMRDSSFRHNHAGGLEGINAMANLKDLRISSTSAWDLAPLRDTPDLERLDAAQTQLIEIGPLAGCSALKYLDLTSTRVRDLQPLVGLQNLRRLFIGGVGATVRKRNVDWLRKRRPDILIHYEE